MKFTNMILVACLCGIAFIVPGTQGAGPRSGDVLQEYVENLRADLKRGKVESLNRVMQLTPEESARFWPIYRDYEEEFFELGDRRLELIRTFGEAHIGHTLDDKLAGELATGWFDNEEKRLTLLKKYHAVLSKELSPIRAAQFAQVEHRFDVVVDLLIASELPLVEAPR